MRYNFKLCALLQVFTSHSVLSNTAKEIMQNAGIKKHLWTSTVHENDNIKQRYIVGSNYWRLFTTSASALHGTWYMLLHVGTCCCILLHVASCTWKLLYVGSCHCMLVNVAPYCYTLLHVGTCCLLVHAVTCCCMLVHVVACSYYIQFRFYNPQNHGWWPIWAATSYNLTKKKNVFFWGCNNPVFIYKHRRPGSVTRNFLRRQGQSASQTLWMLLASTTFRPWRWRQNVPPRLR
jgi:hypothetical protein